MTNDPVQNHPDNQWPVGWQSIESAPRDGSDFLAYYNSDFGPRMGPMSWLADNSAEGGYFHSWSTLTQSRKATHWQPLPPPPRETLE